MNVDAVGSLANSLVAPEGVAAGGSVAKDFSTWLQQQVSTTNTKIVESDRWVQRLVVGEVDNLHQVMIALDEAKSSFQLLTQVRNKLLEAYQDILRMQV